MSFYRLCPFSFDVTEQDINTTPDHISQPYDVKLMPKYFLVLRLKFILLWHFQTWCDVLVGLGNISPGWLVISAYLNHVS